MRHCVECKLFVTLVLVLLNTHQSDSTHYRNDTTQDQLVSFALRVQNPIGLMTTGTGLPVTIQETTTINSRLLLNNYFLESMTHLPRERVPERVVHAKGTGAFGHFKVTHSISNICKAKMFTQGKETPLVVRFSPVIQRPGGIDTDREVRGFAVKFYTEEGNWDFVAIHTEMFIIKDPIFFTTFVHSFHKNPVTQVFDQNSRWDFLTSRPETLNTFMRIWGDRGIPDGYRHLPGFTIHTFELSNDHGEKTFARFHLLPDQGIKNLTTEKAMHIQARDTDYANRDLYNAIATGNYPTWTLYIQTIPENEVNHADFDIFDVTRYWPTYLYKLQPVGKLVLNKNPENHFADIEQLAFNPAHLLPGIRGVDTLFEARALSYREANIYRLGINFNKIHVNCPLRTTPKTYERDGRPPVKDNEGDSPNYYPNSFNGPLPDKHEKSSTRTMAYTSPDVTNFDQANEIYINMTPQEKCRLIETIIQNINEAELFLQKRAVTLYTAINKDLGKKIEHFLSEGVVDIPCDHFDDFYFD